MSGNCTSRICSPKKSKERFLSAKKWSWSRKGKPTQSIPLPLCPGLQKIIKKQLHTAPGEKDPPFPITLSCTLQGGRREKKNALS